MKKTILFAALFCFMFAMTAQAKDIWEMAESPVYGEKAGGMLGRGILNAASSPVDIPVQTVKGAQKNKPEFIGAVGGFATGAVCTILRASSGVIDAATFWVPGFNGIPVSRSYENCLDFGAKAVAPAQAYSPPPAAVYQSTAPAAPAESRLKYVKK